MHSRRCVPPGDNRIRGGIVTAISGDSGRFRTDPVRRGRPRTDRAGRGRGRSTAPRDTRPFGKSYREWAAAWTEWAVQTKGSAHPLLDTTTDCSAGQRGRVWFLGGDFGGGGRRVGGGCTVPEGGGLFVALPPRVRP